MKKYTWLVALVIALSFVAVGCDTGGGGKKKTLVWKTVFDMQEDAGIQALTEGELSFAGDVQTIKPLNRAGGDDQVKITAVKKDGKIALQYEGLGTTNWGPGIDLPNAAFGFSNGDKITITGEFIDPVPEGYAQPNFKVGSEDGGGFKVSAAGPISWEITLDAVKVGMIKAGSPSAIRLDSRATSAGNGTVVGQKVLITQIKIEGNRPSDVKKLAKPAITLDGSTVSWTAIDGAGKYTLVALAEGATEPTKIDIAADKTSYNLATSSLKPTKYTEAAVKYSVTLIAVGVLNVTEDSDPSNAVEYTKPTPEPPTLIKIKVGGTEVDAELYKVAGEIVEVKDATETTKTIGYTFTKGAGYEASYAYLLVDLGTGKTLKDYSQVKIDYVGVSGDVGYKDLQLKVSTTEFEGNMLGATATVNKKRFDEWAAINPSNGSATGKLTFGDGPQVNNAVAANGTILKIDPDKAAGYSGNEVYVSIYFGAAAEGKFNGASADDPNEPTAFTVSNIEFIAATTTGFTHTVYFVTDATDNLLLAYTATAVAHNSALTAPAPMPPTNAKMLESYNGFSGSSITGWKKADGTAATVGTTTVTNDLILYAVKP